MIRKFSITNTYQLLSAEDQQRLQALSNCSQRRSQSGSEVTDSTRSQQDVSSDIQHNRQPPTRQPAVNDHDYEDIYISQVDDEETSNCGR